MMRPISKVLPEVIAMRLDGIADSDLARDDMAAAIRQIAHLIRATNSTDEQETNDHRPDA
jgi:hypothetical protein